MGLKNTKRQIEKQKAKMAAMQAKLDELEKQERGQEDEDIVKKIRKTVDYPEFLALWEEMQKHKNELLERHKNNGKEDTTQTYEKNNSDINSSGSGA